MLTRFRLGASRALDPGSNPGSPTLLMGDLERKAYILMVYDYQPKVYEYDFDC